VKKRIAKIIRKRKKNIAKRIDRNSYPTHDGPVLNTPNIQYDLSERDRGFAYGGIGVVQRMVKQLQLDQIINQNVRVFKIHNPYYESDHVLNIAYNILCQGDCLEDIERLRNDEAYLDALGAVRIPDPTTAGDFCRRFDTDQIKHLQDAINQARVKVWKQQDLSFFKQAIIDGDGTIAPTTGECKQGMDISYKGIWGYHPLVVSLANTQEALFVVNRSGNQTSSSGAAAYFNQAAALCQQGGFESIRFRGDTDFSQTAYLDDWDDRNILFNFGIAAMPNLVEKAEALPETAWEPLERKPKYTVKTQPRDKPLNVKEQIIKARKFKNLHLQCEAVAEFDYQPTLCKKPYRMVVLRKNISVEKGEEVLFDEIRYFFYITNDRQMSNAEIVFDANQRCHQENLLDQLKNGVHSMRMPVETLESNWAYMVMASLAWSLKSWVGLLLPTQGRWSLRWLQEKAEVMRMEFKQFCHYFIHLPCQIIQTGRRVVYRILGWNQYLPVLLRAFEGFCRPLRC
jgi:hypothetical protein